MQTNVDDKQKIDSQQNAVMAALVSEFDYVGYIDFETRNVIRYRASKVFIGLINQIEKANKNLLPHEKLTAFFSTIMHEDDVAKFTKDVRVSKILSELAICPTYEVFFRAIINGTVFYYKVRFSRDENNNKGVVFFLSSFDEQAQAKIRHKKAEENRKLVERQVELVITERTEEIQKKNKALNRINEDIVELLGEVTEARDLESGHHIKRVKSFTHILAQQVMSDWPQYKLTQNRIELITSASALHDIGKITIPDSILLKPGKLTDQEFDVMKKHTLNGYELLKRAPKDWSEVYLKTSLEICRSHHEKWDGQGYPEGLKEDQIPISAQIVSVADCFDALTTKRPYKNAIAPARAYEMILGGQCGVFSDYMLKSFVHCREQFVDYAMHGEHQIEGFQSCVSADRLSGIRVLLVEDNDLSRMIERETLEAEGATVIEARNPKQALEIFQALVPETFDAILMDVNMPEMSGIELTRVIRGLEIPQAKAIPIIAITSADDDKTIRECFIAGMSTYLTKPVRVNALIDSLLITTK